MALGRRPKQGLTAGEAATFCLVSPPTILNWIRSGQLEAQRTVGGHYRIRRGELRRFMVSNRMSTEALDAFLHPFCFEHFGTSEGSPQAACEGCPVRTQRTHRCSETRDQSSYSGWLNPRCKECSYGCVASGWEGDRAKR